MILIRVFPPKIYTNTDKHLIYDKTDGNYSIKNNPVTIGFDVKY